MAKSLSKRVIVISNRPDLPGRLNRRLAEHGYYVLNAQPDDEALEDVIRYFLPVLLIIDLDAPAMTGIELCLRLHLNSPVPTLILTNWRSCKGCLRYFDPMKRGWLSPAVTIEEVMDRVDNIARR